MANIIISDPFGPSSPKLLSYGWSECKDALDQYISRMSHVVFRANHLNDEQGDATEEDQCILAGRIIPASSSGNVFSNYLLETKKGSYILESAEMDLLYPGKFIAAHGVLSSNRFIIDKIYDDLRADLPIPIPHDLKLSIVIASGPYVYSSLDSAASLNIKIKSVNPDLVILFGPFADQRSPILSDDRTQYTALELTSTVTTILTDGLNCVAIPSTLDSLAFPSCPTVPIQGVKGCQNSSNPSFLTVENDLSIMATSYDCPKYSKSLSDVAKQNSAAIGISPEIRIPYLSTLIPRNPVHLIACRSEEIEAAEQVDQTHVVSVKPYMDESTPGKFAVVTVSNAVIHTVFTSGE